jgi:type IV pilus assembly protein PilX
MRKLQERARRREGGAILVVSLLLLLVLTILAVTTMRASTFQERMAGNARDTNLAFQSSEAAARNAEQWLFSLGERPIACGTLAGCDLGGLEVVGPDVLPDIRGADEAWWDANGVQFGTADDDIELVSDDPAYVAEELGFVRDNFLVGEAPPEGRMVYRIYSRGEGGTEVAQAVVESTFTRRF